MSRYSGSRSFLEGLPGDFVVSGIRGGSKWPGSFFIDLGVEESLNNGTFLKWSHYPLGGYHRALVVIGTR